MNIFIASDFNNFARCMMIRTRVFVIEQNIAANLETDEFENTSTHYLVGNGEGFIATARSRFLEDKETAKIERVAVLKEARGKGVGRQLMDYILNDLYTSPHLKTIKLGSQKTAIGFYQKLGFQVIGEEYIDAGIPHHLMMKIVS
ncbi:GNAT family N-acetyltransferase [Dactylococcopsis salina]|uniref:Acyltransferase n=1 Tax=Dactylococcopsis salina (strain PCC 8305) TaxID=13035 RepID=K9YQD5_DACS8|nr:GNAT family N-acetyltransferase [Dactylococcopsis salina]AFZ49136.1 putative acyltransferase [Dactylococcopsis salina PCC 8305]